MNRVTPVFDQKFERDVAQVERECADCHRPIECNTPMVWQHDSINSVMYALHVGCACATVHRIYGAYGIHARPDLTRKTAEILNGVTDISLVVNYGKFTTAFRLDVNEKLEQLVAGKVNEWERPLRDAGNEEVLNAIALILREYEKHRFD